MILKALMASYMRPRQGKALSLLKLHEKTGNLGSLIGKIMNYKVIDALKDDGCWANMPMPNLTGFKA